MRKGQHNEEILVGLLRCSPKRLKRLREEEEGRSGEVLKSIMKGL